MSQGSSRPNMLVGLVRATIPGIALLAVVGVVSVTAIRFFQHRSVLRGFPAQMKSEVGDAAVKGIYAYRNEFGLWPLELADAVPLQIRYLPPPEWEYVWNGYDGEVGPVLLRAKGPLDIAVQYQFPVADEPSPTVGWTATSGDDPIWIDPSQEIPAPAEVPADELAERRRKVLERRTLTHRHDDRHAAEFARVSGDKP